MSESSCVRLVSRYPQFWQLWFLCVWFSEVLFRGFFQIVAGLGLTTLLAQKFFWARTLGRGEGEGVALRLLSFQR